MHDTRVNNDDDETPSSPTTTTDSETKNPSSSSSSSSSFVEQNETAAEATPTTITVCQEEEEEEDVHQTYSETPKVVADEVDKDNNSNSTDNEDDDDKSNNSNNSSDGNDDEDDDEDEDDDDDDNNNNASTTTATNSILSSAVEAEAQAEEEDHPFTHVVTTALDNILEFSYRVQDHTPQVGVPRKMFCFSFSAATGNFLGRMEIRKQPPDLFLIFCTSPVNIPITKRVAVAEFLGRVNYGLVFGYWEMDMNDGEIQHKTVTRSHGMTADEVATLFSSSVYVVNTFFPGIMAVTYAGKSPNEAYRDCLAAHSNNNNNNTETPEEQMRQQHYRRQRTKPSLSCLEQ